MKEIKSVRLRKTNDSIGTLDIKVTLYEDKKTFGSNERVLIGTNNSNPIWLLTRYKKGGIFKEFTDDQFIDNFILLQSKSDSKSSGYKIIQDPWEEKVPKYRSYGSDPYYLNNGAFISISWVEGNMVAGGVKYSDSDGNELGGTQKGFITKIPSINSYSNEKVISINKNGIFEYTLYSQEFSGTVDDIDIVKYLIAKWIIAIPDYSELALCEPNNVSCSIIPYKSPLIPIVPEAPTPDKAATNEAPKIKLKIILPTDVIIKAKVDIPSIKVYIGDVKEVVSGFQFTDEEEFTISDEYTENNFEGLPEVEFILQKEVSDNEEDSESSEGTIGDPANIRPVYNLDELLKLAGDCARELGKNSRINYKNLRQGYLPGVHGLCPQGVVAVLYALTGVKKIGQVRGNAEKYSFRGGVSLSATGYFNDKVRVTELGYFNSPSKWQIGDVIAVGYLYGKPYGHIQVWTGYKWMSDFTQRQLHTLNVDWNTAALWRMNEKGVEAVKLQSGALV
jgi:hypothetical protein